MYVQDLSVLLSSRLLLASPALPLEPWTAHILLVNAVDGVKTSSLVSLTQPLGPDSGN